MTESQEALGPKIEQPGAPARAGSQEAPGFEAEHPEVLKLKERIEKLEQDLEREKTPENREKIVKQEIKKYIQGVQQTPSFASPSSTRDEVKEISKFEASQQIGALVSLVFEKGLAEAISVAKGLENPAVLDEFHDSLVDRYYETMIEKGILKTD